MASERVLITFEVDASGAIRQVDNVKKTVKEIPAATSKAEAGFKKLTVALAAIGGVVVAFRAAMSGIKNSLQFLGNATEEAAEQQKIFSLLEGSVDRLGGSYARLKPILDSHFLTIQRNTQFGDTESAEAMQQLIDTTGQLKSSYELLEPTMDLAVSKGMELGNAVKLVGMVYNGQLGTLSRYGIALDETQREMLQAGSDAEKTAVLVELLGEKFGGAAKIAGSTTQGAWAGIQNAMGDVRESIGDVIVQSNLLPAAFNVIENLLLNVATAITDFTGKFREIEDVIMSVDFSPAAEAIAGIADALKSFKSEVDWEVVKAGIAVLAVLAQEKVVRQLGLAATAIETIASAVGWLGETLGSDKINVAPLRGFTESAAQARGEVSELFDELEDRDPWEQTQDAVEDTGAAFRLAGKLLEQGGAAIGAAGERIAKDMEKLNKINAMEGLKEQTQEVAETLEVVTGTVKELAVESELSTNKTRNHFSDLADDISNVMGEALTVTLLGEWDNFFDLLDRNWKASVEGLIGHFADAFGEAFSGEGDGKVFSALKEGWAGIKAEIEADPIGSAITGVSGAFAASQGGGGWGGGLQGAIGGGMAAIGSMAAIYGTLAAIPVAGWIIAGVLAVVSGIIGFSGGGGVTPESRGIMDFSIGSGYITGHRDQQIDNIGERAWVQDRIEEWRAAYDGMYELVGLFGDPELFDLLGKAGKFEWGGKGDLNTWAQLFREEIIPDALRDVFELAIETGLGDLGVSDAKIKQLWAELDVMGTDRMIESLSTFVAAVVGMADMLDSMQWNQILDEAGMDSMERFAAMTANVIESINMQMTGMGEMDPIQQAELAIEIQQTVAQVRQAEIQMLQQIQQLQDQINISIDRQIESINLGNMEPGEQSQYFLEQIVSSMDYLNSGGIGSPEELQQVMADLLSYIQQYQSIMGENLYVAGSDGIVPSEWLIKLLEEARGLANDQLEAFRQDLLDQNQAIIELLTQINENLTMTQTEVEVGGEIDITVRIDPGLWADIDERIRVRIRQHQLEGERIQ